MIDPGVAIAATESGSKRFPAIDRKTYLFVQIPPTSPRYLDLLTSTVPSLAARRSLVHRSGFRKANVAVSTTPS